MQCGRRIGVSTAGLGAGFRGRGPAFPAVHRRIPCLAAISASSSTAHPIEHAGVFAGFALPEQPRRRIPGAVVAIEQPAVVRRIGQQDPGRAPERRGEMGDAGIHRDDEIEAVYQRCGLDEVGQMRGEVDDVGVFMQHRPILGSRVLLQADERRIDVEHRQKHPQRDRPVMIVACARGLPDQTMPTRNLSCSFPGGRGGPARPARGRGRRRQIRNLGRDAVEPRSKHHRQARQADNACRTPAARRPRTAGTAQTPGSPDSSGCTASNHQDDAGAARRHHRHIARELDRIAQSLVDMDQDGLAFDVFLAHATSARKISDSPPKNSS